MSNKNIHIESFFDSNGCLSLQAMEKYYKDQLTEKEIELVEKHLSDCLFCKEAVEGISMIEYDKEETFVANDQKSFSESNSISENEKFYFRQPVKSIVDELNKTIKEKAINYNNRKSKNRITFLSLAASILLICGISVYFYFIGNQKTSYIAEFKKSNVSKDHAVTEPAPVITETSPTSIPENKNDIQNKRIASKVKVLEDNEIFEEKKISRNKDDKNEISTLKNIVETDEQMASSADQIMLDLNETEEKSKDILSEKKVENPGSLYEKRKKAEDLRSSAAAPSKIDNAPKTSGASVKSQVINIDQQPQFKNGQNALTRFIKENMIYPDSLRKNNVAGKIGVRFYVSPDSKISNITLINKIHPVLDQEAIRIVQLMNGLWNPATNNGKPVNESVAVSISIDFRK